MFEGALEQAFPQTHATGTWAIRPQDAAKLFTFLGGRGQAFPLSFQRKNKAGEIREHMRWSAGLIITGEGGRRGGCEPARQQGAP